MKKLMGKKKKDERKSDKCLKEFYWRPVLRSHKCPAAAEAAAAVGT